MAKIFVDRITQKLGISPENLSGQNYQDVMSEVIYQNTKNIQRAVGRLTNASYEKQIVNLKKKGRLKEKVVLLPSMDDVLPKRSVAVTKSAESGKQITQTLSDSMNRSLRNTLKEWKASGKPLEIGSGVNAGKINPELIKSFENNITDVFHDYTRRDPSIGVPANVKSIAITEIRSNIDAVKAEYHKELLRKNIDTMKMTKTWRQNRSLSKVPRIEHSEVDGVTIARDESFKVPSPKGGYDLMMNPHDPQAPAGQVIHCSCDAVYKAVLL